jgi:cell division septation protein DedD
MQDEGFHEIQLNGKQLVFLFMAGTVVAVVIFLCGVMVGRGVPERAGLATTGEPTPIDPTASIPALPSTAVAGDTTKPITAGETLTYPSRLEDPDPPAETLAPAAETAVATALPAPRPAPKPVAKPAPLTPPAAAPVAAVPAPKPAPATVPAVAATSLAEPEGTGFVVQVAAVRQRTEAEVIAKRLNGKGYPAFVTTAGANFRVRVGKFDDRRQAETVAGRLAREEQFKPWITR